jgi:hypothetical protein
MVIIIGENIAMAELITLLPVLHLTAIITTIITTITADAEMGVTGTVVQFTVTDKTESVRTQ